MKLTKKTFIVASLVSVAFLAALPVFSVEPGFDQIAVFATNSARLQRSSDILSGDLVVNQDASSPPHLTSFQLTVGLATTTPAGFAIKADEIKVKSTATIGGDVFCNSLNDGSGNVTCQPLSLPVFAVLPDFKTGSTGGTQFGDVTVNIGQSAQLAPGDYGDLRVKKNGTVDFTGGVYSFRSIIGGIANTFSFAAPSEIRVEEKFDTDKNSFVGPAAGCLKVDQITPCSASDVVFYVAGINGNNGNLGATPKAAQVGLANTVVANFYVPNGTLHLRQNTNATGAFLGRDVNVGIGVQVTLDSFFSNQPPDAVDDEYNAAEDTQLIVAPPGVLGNDSDPDLDALSVTAFDAVSASAGVVSVAADGSFTYDPVPNFCGDDSFGYTASDNALTDSATVTIHVACVNDPPVAVDDVAGTDENTSVIVAVLANDFDVDGDSPLTVTIAQGATTSGAVTTDGTTVTYTPSQNFFGEDRFGYMVCDPSNACDDGEVVVTVNDLGDPPTATIGITATTSGAAAITIDISGTDPNGDSLVFSQGSGPSQGAVSALPSTAIAPVAGTSTFTVTYTPTTANDLEDSFFFQVDDGNGGTDTAEVLINPGAESQPPPELADLVAFDQLTQTPTDEGISIVLEGDAPCDPAGAVNPAEPCDGVGNDVPLNFLVGATTAQGGTLTNVVQGTEVPQRSATVEYVPALGFTGIDSFTFTVEGDVDGVAPLETAVATVQIDVQNRMPLAPVVAEPQTVSTEQDVPVEIDLSGGVGDSGVGGPHTLVSGAVFASASSFVSSGGGSSESNGVISGGSLAPVSGDTPTALVAIGVGSGWSATSTVPPAFFWTGYTVGQPKFADDGPFDFVGDACVSVTDDFQQGDQFRVYDNGFPIPIFDSSGTFPPPGETPVVARAGGTQAGIGPDAAFVDAGFSSWTFEVGGGPTAPHSITIEIIGQSFSGGRGYIRVDPQNSGSTKCTLGQPTYTINSLPDVGSLSYFGFDPQTFEPADVPITSVPFQLPVTGLALSTVKYTPPAGQTGGDFTLQEPLTSFSFGVSDGFSSASANVDLYVVLAAVLAEQCTFNGREVGCMPGQGPVSAPAPVGGLPTGSAFTVEVSGPGTVSSSRPYADGKSYLGLVCGADSDCGANFVSGSTVVLYARPEEAGSEFVEWGGDCYGADPVAVVTADRATLCTATFKASRE